jgi:hypothetical protein
LDELHRREGVGDRELRKEGGGLESRLEAMEMCTKHFGTLVVHFELDLAA